MMIMKIYRFITAATAAVMLFSSVVYAEETPAPDVAEVLEEKKPTRYLKPASTFDPVPGERINIDKESYIFYLDSQTMSADLNAEIMPMNAKEKGLSFSSGDTNIVTVSETGVITVANVPGKAVIYISGGCDKDGNPLYRECSVEVRRAVTGVSLSSADMSFFADRPTTAQLSANVMPADATNKEVIWSSSDTSVAGVDANGVVSTCGAGTATVTATTVDGGFKAQCVVRSSVYNISVKGMFITNAVKAIPVGSDYAVTAYIYPENARDKSVVWDSTDPDIVSIDQNGVMHANAEGYSVITARAANGMEDYFTVASVVPETEPFEYENISEPLEGRIAALSVPVRYTEYPSDYGSVLSTQLRQSPVVFTTNSRSASQSEVEQYLNVSNLMTGAARYQFLDLSTVSRVDSRMLDVYLSDKGILKGKGKTFRAAAETYGINAAYLAIHACLESGGGTSELGCGVSYNGATVYNLFGIGAYDADPVGGGAKHAFDMGWFDVESAIYGGAKWISENYINAGQNTLYKMRWNPGKPGTHQYATDVAWAAKQAQTLQAFMEVFPIAELVFDVPVYAGEASPQMRYN